VRTLGDLPHGACADDRRARDTRAADAVGRAARLELVFEVLRGRTALARAYAEPPFRIGRAFDLDGAAYVILVCSGPGVFGGDRLTQSIHVGRGARVLLTTQAALQAHPAARSSHEPATLHQHYGVDEDAELHCHWDPVIPFAGACLEQIVDVRLAERSRLYWNDALMAGRIGRGERWRFERLAHELSVSIAGRRAYLERYTLAPRDRIVDRAWTTGGAAYFSTALVRDPRATAEKVEALRHRLAAFEGVSAGVDLVEPSLAVARLTGASGASFARARTSYRERTLGVIFQRPELAARK